MRDYTAKKYIKLTEQEPNDLLKAFMKAEEEVIANLPNKENKIFVDLGAGFGRILPIVARYKKIICIECNAQMINELQKRAKNKINTQIIIGDMTQLPSGPKVFALLQNTLGTIEGSKELLIRELHANANEHDELVLSLFRAQTLENWGTKLYTEISYMTGRPDIARCDFSNGFFVSDTGYTSQWWTDQAIEQLLNDLKVHIISEKSAEHYRILHLRFCV